MCREREKDLKEVRKKEEVLFEYSFILQLIHVRPLFLAIWFFSWLYLEPSIYMFSIKQISRMEFFSVNLQLYCEVLFGFKTKFGFSLTTMQLQFNFLIPRQIEFRDFFNCYMIWLLHGQLWTTVEGNPKGLFIWEAERNNKWDLCPVFTWRFGQPGQDNKIE